MKELEEGRKIAPNVYYRSTPLVGYKFIYFISMGCRRGLVSFHFSYSRDNACSGSANSITRRFFKTVVTCKIKHLQHVCKKCFSILFYM